MDGVELVARQLRQPLRSGRILDGRRQLLLIQLQVRRHARLQPRTRRCAGQPSWRAQGCCLPDRGGRPHHPSTLAAASSAARSGSQCSAATALILPCCASRCPPSRPDLAGVTDQRCARLTRTAAAEAVRMVSGWPSRRDAAAAAAANVWAELAMHDCVQGTVQACECLPAVPTRAPPVQSSSHQCGKAERSRASCSQHTSGQHRAAIR